MENYVTISAINIEYDQFPEKFLLKFFKEDYHNITDYIIPDYMKKEQPLLGNGSNVITGFKVDCHNYFNEQLRPIGDKFCKYFGITNSFVTHFLCVEPHYVVDWHKDGGDVVCAVNLMLEGDPCPVEFEDGSHSYKLALLDVQALHKVNNNSSKQRIIFRISFMDGTYKEIRDKCRK